MKARINIEVVDGKFHAEFASDHIPIDELATVIGGVIGMMFHGLDDLRAEAERVSGDEGLRLIDAYVEESIKASRAYTAKYRSVVTRDWGRGA